MHRRRIGGSFQSRRCCRRSATTRGRSRRAADPSFPNSDSACLFPWVDLSGKSLRSGKPAALMKQCDEIRAGFQRSFWVANITEMFERLSYYAVFGVLALYLHDKLNFTSEKAASLTGTFGFIAWFLPIFGGAVVDKIGYRRALSTAYFVLSIAYFVFGSIGAPWMAGLRNAVPLEALVLGVLVLPRSEEHTS